MDSLKYMSYILVLLFAFGCKSSGKESVVYSVYSVLENSEVCLDIDSASWDKLMRENNPKIMIYSYYCDTNVFKKHFLIEKDNGRYYLVEGKIGHGSGEYDNFIVKIDNSGGGSITQYFKGYLENIYIDDQITCSYKFYLDANRFCIIKGKFADSVFISFNNHIDCMNQSLINEGYVWND